MNSKKEGKQVLDCYEMSIKKIVFYKSKVRKLEILITYLDDP